MAFTDPRANGSAVTPGDMCDTRQTGRTEALVQSRGETVASDKGGLARIGIVVEGGARPADDVLTGNAPPLLREIRDLLQRLIDTGEGGAIDLHAMPLSAADLHWLAGQLGEGEVKVSLNSGGVSSITETQAPGVWWVTHRNERDKVVSEFIEVCWVPELVAAQPEDAGLGLDYLDSLVLDLAPP